MKSCDVMQKKELSLFRRAFLGVLCLRPKALLGAACILAGALILVGAVKAQSLVNFPGNVPTAEQGGATHLINDARANEPVLNYQPKRPPLASDPGVLQAPELIARDLNESDASYTARMTRLNQLLKADNVAAQQHLARVLQQVSKAGHGMGADAVTVQPRQALDVRSSVPMSQRLPQIYDDGRGQKIPAEQVRVGGEQRVQ